MSVLAAASTFEGYGHRSTQQFQLNPVLFVQSRQQIIKRKNIATICKVQDSDVFQAWAITIVIAKDLSHTIRAKTKNPRLEKVRFPMIQVAIGPKSRIIYVCRLWAGVAAVVKDRCGPQPGNLQYARGCVL